LRSCAETRMSLGVNGLCRRPVGARWLAASMLVLSAVFCACCQAQQDSYPSRPVTLVSPYPPGGGVDHLARALLDPLQRSLKQTVSISYRPGAAAAVGTASVAQAEP